MGSGSRISVIALLLFVVVLATTLQVWAITTIKHLDLISTSDRLEIGMHTGTIVPAKIVDHSSDRVTIDVSDIDATASLTTEFSGLGNITHLTIQPINNNQLRLIIRGQQLGQPSIGFKPAADDINDNSTSIDNLLPNTADTNNKPFTTDAKPKIELRTLPNIDAAIQTHSTPKPAKTFASVPNDNTINKTPVKPLFAALPEKHGESQSNSDANRLQQLLNADKPMTDDKAATSDTDTSINDSDSFQSIWHLFQQQSFGILGWMIAILSGLGAFILINRRFKQYRQEANEWDEATQTNARAKPPLKPLGITPDRQAVVGLNSLERQIQPSPDPNFKLAVNRTISGKLALRHYQKASTPKNVEKSDKLGISRQATSATVAKNRLTQDEVRRSATVKTQTVKAYEPPRVKDVTKANLATSLPKLSDTNGVRASLAQIASGKAPLPANPEVLDFLKSVADLIDQEQGKRPKN